MKRLNIEISYNIYRIVQFLRERSEFNLWDLLTRARDYLPMPHKQVQKNRQMVNAIYGSLATGKRRLEKFESGERRELTGSRSNGSPEPKLPHPQVAPEDADRFLANVLTNHAWRNTIIEEIHGGRTPVPALRPHEQRFNRKDQRAVMREVTANMGSVLFTMDTLFDPNYELKDLPLWPRSATAVANSLYGISVSRWSLTGSSSPIALRK